MNRFHYIAAWMTTICFISPALSAPPERTILILMSPSPDAITTADLAALAGDDAKVQRKQSREGIPYEHVTWPGLAIVVSEPAQADFAAQMQATLQLIATFPRTFTEMDPGKAAIKTVKQVKHVYACEIVPQADHAGIAVAFICRMAQQQGAVVFAGTTFFDKQGLKTMGPAVGPSILASASLNDSRTPMTRAQLVGTWKVNSATLATAEENVIALMSGTETFAEDGAFSADVQFRLHQSLDQAPIAEVQYTRKGTWSLENNMFEIQNTSAKVTAFKKTLEEVSEPDLVASLENISDKPVRMRTYQQAKDVFYADEITSGAQSRYTR